MAAVSAQKKVMKNASKLTVIIALLLNSCVSDDKRTTAKHEKSAIAGVQSFMLTEPELASKEKAAKFGDVAASHSVSNFYLFVRNDLDQALYWLKFAVNQGDELAKENYEALSEAKSNR